MRPGLFVITSRGSLAPATARTKEALRSLRLGPGDFVTVQVMRARNAKLCSLAHVVIAKLAEGLGVTSEAIKTRLKLELGYFDLVQMQDGKVEHRVSSLGFDEMLDEDSFAEFWRAAEVLVANILPELEPSEQDEILAIMQGRARA